METEPEAAGKAAAAEELAGEQHTDAMRESAHTVSAGSSLGGCAVPALAALLCCAAHLSSVICAVGWRLGVGEGGGEKALAREDGPGCGSEAGKARLRAARDEHAKQRRFVCSYV